MNNRLKEIRKQLNLTQDDMSKIIGISRSTYTGIENGKAQLTSRNKMSIIDSLHVNLIWLETGIGDMITPSYIIEELKEIHATCAEEIKACNDREQAMESISFVPLLPISAQGGTLNDFVMSAVASDCEKIVSPIRDVDFAITIAGDSMSPEYPAGSHVLIKKINEKAFIDWGKIYILDTCNGTVVKKLMPGRDETKVTCVSINPAYPPFEVAFENIFGVYRVMMCMSIK